MTTVTNTDSVYAQYAFPAATASKSQNDMGQADFLRLMTEQLKHQDPLDPMKGAEFLGQLAQFSTVQGIENMQQAMNAMALVMENDQSLRAANLVGRDALVEVDNVKLADGATAKGEVVATQAGPIQIEVSDASGQVVSRFTVEAKSSGTVAFEWDGKTDAGTDISAGNYSFKARSGTDKDSEALSLRLSARIDSVSIEPQGLVLNLDGLGSMSLSAVRRIG